MKWKARPMRPLPRRPLLLGAVGLLLGVALFRQCYRFSIVVGDSMLPTFRSGEVLLVDRGAYRMNSPERGDVVLARYGSEVVLKRIVGLPGEEVEVKHGTVYVDGRAQDEQHGIEAGALDVGKGELSEDDYATLGDNRAIPAALAIHPIVSEADLLGKVLMRIRLPRARTLTKSS
jgi:signal peptidase I